MKKNMSKNFNGLWKRTFLSVLVLFATLSGRSQTLADTIRSEMAAINRVYDSAFFLTFDIKIVYHSDTVMANTDSADFTHTEMQGTFTFHANKALYRLGDIEFLQNDAYTIAVYKENKFMLVGKPQVGAGRPGVFVPTNSMLDSMLEKLGEEYESYFFKNDSIGKIVFKAFASSAIYERVEVEYDPANYRLLKVFYRFRDDGLEASNSANDPAPGGFISRKAEMTYWFQRYRVEELGSSVFSETKYLFFDGPADIRPAHAYREYAVYKNF